MAKGAKKGEVRNPRGRGSAPNKATTASREAIAAFVNKNTARLERLLDKIEQESAKDAFNCIMSVVEYHVPKLQRTDAVNINLSEKSLTKEQRDAAYRAAIDADR
jgi:hypothetical protein